MKIEELKLGGMYFLNGVRVAGDEGSTFDYRCSVYLGRDGENYCFLYNGERIELSEMIVSGYIHEIDYMSGR